MSAGCCLGCSLMILHALVGLGARFICMYSLIGWNLDTCLPAMMDQEGHLIPDRHDLETLCAGLVYGMAAVSLVNFLTCLVVNNNCYQTGTACLSLLMAVVCMSFTVVAGSAIGVYYLVWCNTLENSFHGSYRCEAAARIFDSHNNTETMALFKMRMEVQTITSLTLFVVIGLAVLGHALNLVIAKAASRKNQTLVFPSETSPLLNHDVAGGVS